MSRLLPAVISPPVNPATIELPLEPVITTGGVIIATLITALATLGGIWLKRRFDRVDAATEPTGNGFARATRNDLERIVAAVDRIEARLGGMETRVDHLSDRFNRHMEDPP